MEKDYFTRHMVKLFVRVLLLWFNVANADDQLSSQGYPSRNLRVLNQKALFQKWPNNKVYFYLDSLYTQEEGQLIRLAIARVVSDLNGCVSFEEVYASAPQFKVKITPQKGETHVVATYCYTYPGVYENARLQGRTEQTMTLARGPTGCLQDGSLHRVMKYFALLLGKRNEHQKADRDKYINMTNSNIIPGPVSPIEDYITF